MNKQIPLFILLIFFLSFLNTSANESGITIISNKLNVEMDKRKSIFTGDVYAHNDILKVWSDELTIKLKTEKSAIHAFDSGYSRAKITVLDANITTLIAAVILFAFGSGPVKGFAITLGIGIVTTLFTAYFLARHLTSMVVLNSKKEINI